MWQIIIGVDRVATKVRDDDLLVDGIWLGRHVGSRKFWIDAVDSSARGEVGVLKGRVANTQIFRLLRRLGLFFPCWRSVVQDGKDVDSHPWNDRNFVEDLDGNFGLVARSWALHVIIGGGPRCPRHLTHEGGACVGGSL